MGCLSQLSVLKDLSWVGSLLWCHMEVNRSDPLAVFSLPSLRPASSSSSVSECLHLSLISHHIFSYPPVYTASPHPRPCFHTLVSFSPLKSLYTELLLILRLTPAFSAGPSPLSNHCPPFKDECWQRGECRWVGAEDMFLHWRKGYGWWAVWTEIWRAGCQHINPSLCLSDGAFGEPATVRAAEMRVCACRRTLLRVRVQCERTQCWAQLHAGFCQWLVAYLLSDG